MITTNPTNVSQNQDSGQMNMEDFQLKFRVKLFSTFHSGWLSPDKCNQTFFALTYWATLNDNVKGKKWLRIRLNCKVVGSNPAWRKDKK